MEKQTVRNNGLLYGLAGVLIFLVGVGATYIFMNAGLVRGYGNRDSMQKNKQFIQEKRGRMMERGEGNYRQGKGSMGRQQGSGQGCRMQVSDAQSGASAGECNCGRHAVEATE